MALSRIEPERAGYDRRTFECRECNASTTKIVEFIGAAKNAAI
jgi:hypothetical protein